MIDLSKIKTIAVVGASNNEDKFGNKILKNLMSRGFEVYPINPREELIEGLKVYKSVKDLPQVPDLVDVVVRAEVGIEVVKDAIEIGVRNIWIQPGAESDDILELLKKYPEVNSVSQACIMLH